MKILAAPLVVPVAGPPIEDGALLVDGTRINAVGTLNDIRDSAPQAQVEWLEDSLLMPALINAHTHLELTDLGTAPPPGDFIGWIKGVIAVKRAAGPEDFDRAIRRGARRCLEYGQGTVADVLSRLDAIHAYPTAGDGPNILCQPELICPFDEDAKAAAAPLASVPSLVSGENVVSGGVFAHTPYTAGELAYREASRLSIALGQIMATHLAESPEETAFCLTGAGPVVERLYEGANFSPPASPGVHPLEWLEGLGLLGAGIILVHVVQLNGKQVEKLGLSGAKVVLCPRSNRYLGVGVAPGRELLDAGVPVALGTDSSLSAGDLDLRGELRAAVDDYGWSPAEAVRAATAGGASVLGLGGQKGAFSPGSVADILALKLGGAGEPYEQILSSPGVRRVWLGGRRVI